MNCQKPGTDDSSSKEKIKYGCPEPSIVLGKPTNAALGITIHDKKWTDGSISLESVSKDLKRLGKVSSQMRIYGYPC